MLSSFPDWAMVSLVLLLGLVIGSFLNVCIYRIPLGESFVRGRSHCPACSALIPWYCNIPLLSYLFLGGRCKSCGAKISVIYPAIELLTGLLFLLVYAVFGPTVDTLLLAALFAVLIVISVIDIRLQIIPDGLVIAILVLGIANGLYQTLVGGAPWYSFVIGFFAASLPLLLLGLIVPGGMGGGDVKLMAVAGLFLGWKLILLALFIGAIYGAIISAGLMLRKKAGMKSAVPFGPFLSLGIMTVALGGEPLLNWYFSLFM